MQAQPGATRGPAGPSSGGAALFKILQQRSLTNDMTACSCPSNKFVRPRWPYDMRPSVRAEKYISENRSFSILDVRS